MISSPRRFRYALPPRMIRILHLLEHGAAFETRRGVESLCRALGDGFARDFRTIGSGGDFRDVPTAAAELRRMRERFDLVHAWGSGALTVAALGANVPIVFSPSPEIPRRSVQWLRAVSTYRRVEVIAPTSTLRRRIVEGGISLERCHLIRPGVELGRLKRRKDSTLRAELGLTDDDVVLLAAGESTRASNQDQALWAASILH